MFSIILTFIFLFNTIDIDSIAPHSNLEKLPSFRSKSHLSPHQDPRIDLLKNSTNSSFPSRSISASTNSLHSDTPFYLNHSSTPANSLYRSMSIIPFYCFYFLISLFILSLAPSMTASILSLVLPNYNLTIIIRYISSFFAIFLFMIYFVVYFLIYQMNKKVNFSKKNTGKIRFYFLLIQSFIIAIYILQITLSYHSFQTWELCIIIPFIILSSLSLTTTFILSLKDFRFLKDSSLLKFARQQGIVSKYTLIQTHTFSSLHYFSKNSFLFIAILLIAPVFCFFYQSDYAIALSIVQMIILSVFVTLSITHLLKIIIKKKKENLNQTSTLFILFLLTFIIYQVISFFIKPLPSIAHISSSSARLQSSSTAFSHLKNIASTKNTSLQSMSLADTLYTTIQLSIFTILCLTLLLTITLLICFTILTSKKTSYLNNLQINPNILTPHEESPLTEINQKNKTTNTFRNFLTWIIFIFFCIINFFLLLPNIAKVIACIALIGVGIGSIFISLQKTNSTKKEKKLFYFSLSPTLIFILFSLIMILPFLQNTTSSWLRVFAGISGIPLFFGICHLIFTGISFKLYKKSINNSPTPPPPDSSPPLNLSLKTISIPETLTYDQIINIEESLIAQNLYESYLHLKYNLFTFFQHLKSVESNFPLIHQMIIEKQIITQQDFKYHLLSYEKKAPLAFKQELQKWDETNMSSILNIYYTLWSSTSKVIQEYILTRFPCLTQHLNSHPLNTKKIEKEEDINFLFNELIQTDSPDSLEQIEKEQLKWNQLQEHSLWWGFKQLVELDTQIPWSPIGDFLHNQLQQAILKLLYVQISCGYSLSPLSRRILPTPSTKPPLETLVSPNKRRLKTSFCQVLSSLIEKQSTYQSVIEALDNRLKSCDPRDNSILKTLNEAIPDITSGSREQLYSFLGQLKIRVYNCHVALYQVPIDLHEVYFQYPNQIDNPKEAFAHILTQKRSAIANKIGNQLENPADKVHAMRCVVYKLHSNYGIQFPQTYLSNASLHEGPHFSEIYEKFSEDLTLPHLLIEEILPLFWQFHQGTTLNGKQFLDCLGLFAFDQDSPSSYFIDVPLSEDQDLLYNHCYRFANPFKLLQHLEEYQLIHPNQKNQRKIPPREGFQKKKVAREKINSIFYSDPPSTNITGQLKSIHPQRFFDYFNTLNTSQKRTVLSKIDIQTLFDHFFPIHNYQKNKLILMEFESIYRSLSPIHHLNFIKTVFSYYDEDLTFKIWDKNTLQGYIKTTTEKAILNDLHLPKVFPFTESKYMKEFIIPVFIENLPSLSQNKKQQLNLIFNSPKAPFFMTHLSPQELQSILQYIPISKKTFQDLMKNIYKLFPNTFIHFYNCFQELSHTHRLHADSNEEAITYFLTTTTDEKILSFFIENSNEEQLLTWFSLYHTFQGDLPSSIFNILRKKNYLKVLYEIYKNEMNCIEMQQTLIQAFINQDFQWIEELYTEWTLSPDIYQDFFKTLYTCIIIRSVFIHSTNMNLALSNFKCNLLDILKVQNLPLSEKDHIKIQTIFTSDELSWNFQDLNKNDIQLLFSCIEKSPSNLKPTLFSCLYTEYPEIFHLSLKMYTNNPYINPTNKEEDMTLLLNLFPEDQENILQYLIAYNDEEKIKEWILPLCHSFINTNIKLLDIIIQNLIKKQDFQVLFEIAKFLPYKWRTLIINTLINEKQYDLLMSLGIHYIEQDQINISLIKYLLDQVTTDSSKKINLSFKETLYQTLYNTYKETMDFNQLSFLITHALNNHQFYLVKKWFEKWSHKLPLDKSLMSLVALFFTSQKLHSKQIISSSHFQNSVLSSLQLHSLPSLSLSYIKRIHSFLTHPQKHLEIEELTQADLLILCKTHTLNLQDAIETTITLYLYHPQLLPTLLPHLSSFIPQQPDLDSLSFRESVYIIIKNLPQKEKYLQLFIKNSKDNELLKWVTHFYLQNNFIFSKDLNQKLIIELEKDNRFDILYHLYQETHDQKAINHLIFNIFLKKEWHILSQWLNTQWILYPEFYRESIQTLLNCFYFVHPCNLKQDFCDQFESSKNPLFSFYRFWEQHKYNQNFFPDIILFYKKTLPYENTFDIHFTTHSPPPTLPQKITTLSKKEKKHRFFKNQTFDKVDLILSHNSKVNPLNHGNIKKQA